MLSYDANAISTAPPAVVWRLLVDARTWPIWSAVDSLVVERSSGLDPDGHDLVGAVRAFRTGRTVTGERLTGLVEEKQLTYEDAFNPTIRNYRAVIDLTPTSDGGTAIHWHLRRPLGAGLADEACHATRHAADGRRPRRPRGDAAAPANHLTDTKIGE